MVKNRLSSPDWGLLGVSVLSGLLLTSAFPYFEIWPIIFAGLVPLIVVCRDLKPGRAFRFGFVAGFVHTVTLLYWLINVLVTYAYLPLIAALPIFFLLTGYLALYPALFALGISNLEKFPGVKPGGLLWMLLGAAIFTGLDYFKSFFLTGFPWEPLGAALAPSRIFVQAADLVGAGGLTFVIVFVNLALAEAYARFRKSGIKSTVFPGACVLAVFMALSIYGHYRYKSIDEAIRAAKETKATIVQASIEQSVKWDPDNRVKTLVTYQNLTLNASSKNPDLIVWPETAAPFFYLRDEAATDWLNNLVKRSKSALLFGAPAFEEASSERRYYNRAYLVDEKAEVLGYYDKVHLVPFGEYVPMKEILFFVRKITEAAGIYFPGKKGKLLELDDEKIGVLICYESIFSALADEQVTSGADYLVIITNDAWFGKSSAPAQHFSQAIIRAVENRRSIIRAANTGISGFIMPDGSVQGKLDLFEQDILEGRVPLLDIKTIYNATGDLIPRLCLGVAALFFVVVYVRRKKC